MMKGHSVAFFRRAHPQLLLSCDGLHPMMRLQQRPGREARAVEEWGADTKELDGTLAGLVRLDVHSSMLQAGPASEPQGCSGQRRRRCTHPPARLLAPKTDARALMRRRTLAQDCCRSWELRR